MVVEVVVSGGGGGAEIGVGVVVEVVVVVAGEDRPPGRSDPREEMKCSDDLCSFLGGSSRLVSERWVGHLG